MLTVPTLRAVDPRALARHPTLSTDRHWADRYSHPGELGYYHRGDSAGSSQNVHAGVWGATQRDKCTAAHTRETALPAEHVEPGGAVKYLSGGAARSSPDVEYSDGPPGRGRRGMRGYSRLLRRMTELEPKGTSARVPSRDGPGRPVHRSVATIVAAAMDGARA